MENHDGHRIEQRDEDERGGWMASFGTSRLKSAISSFQDPHECRDHENDNRLAGICNGHNMVQVTSCIFHSSFY